MGERRSRWIWRHALAATGLTLAAGTPCTAADEAAALSAAFRTCVSLHEQPLAADLMRTIFIDSVRQSFAETYRDRVDALSIETEHGYSTATASLKPGLAVAGVPARAIYASTCPIECPLTVWGLEFGRITDPQKSTLQAWVDAAPDTETDTGRSIKVQLTTDPEDGALLVCDVSG